MNLRHPIDLALVVALDDLFPQGWNPESIYALLVDILEDDEDLP